MIQINLLPLREARRKADMQQQLLLLGLALGASLAVCLLAEFAMLAATSSAEARVMQLNSRISGFQTQLAQVEDFKKKASEIERKLGVIHKLDLSRSGPVRLLDELASRSPEKLWITKLRTEGTRIQLDGISLDTELIAEFLNKLNDSLYIKDVELKKTELADASGLKLNSFQVTAVLTSPEAEASQPATSAPAPTTPAAPAKQG
jgi:type IV pilus assembly protein PilN